MGKMKEIWQQMMENEMYEIQYGVTKNPIPLDILCPNCMKKHLEFTSVKDIKCNEGCGQEFILVDANTVRYKQIMKKDKITIKISEHNVDFEYTYELGERETRDHPGTDVSITILAAWMPLVDKNGNLNTVDVLNVLDMYEEYEFWKVEEKIINYIKDNSYESNI